MQNRCHASSSSNLQNEQDYTPSNYIGIDILKIYCTVMDLEAVLGRRIACLEKLNEVGSGKSRMYRKCSCQNPSLDIFKEASGSRRTLRTEF